MAGLGFTRRRRRAWDRGSTREAPCGLLTDLSGMRGWNAPFPVLVEPG